MASDNSNLLQSNIDDLLSLLMISKKSNIYDIFSLFMIPKKESLDESKDIDILSQIRQSIIDYENGQLQIKSVLKIIGHLSSQITYNDNNDPNSRYIRNQYGFIRRNKNNSINKDGIYFESLSYLKIISCDDMIGRIITDDEWNDLGTELIFLKQKIDLILSEQNSANEKSFNQSNIDISKLTGFSKKYYDQVVLRRIIYELDHMESIDFRIKEDRYYFGRIYSIIGELFNEWLQDQENKEHIKVIKTLNKFKKLRHKLVHHHERINFLTEPDNESINDIIVKIRNYLGKIIVANQFDPNVLKIVLSSDLTEEFNNLFDELLALINKKKNEDKIDIKQKENKMSNDEKLKTKLYRCIKKAYEIIADTNEQSNFDNESINKQNKTLKKINDDYKAKLNNLSEEERKNFPPTLDSDHIKEMKSLQNHVVPNLSVTSSKPTDKKWNLFLKKITAAIEEMHYLFYSIIKRMNFEENEHNRLSDKTRYIIEHSVLLIGQMVRDIEGVNICQLKTIGNRLLSNDPLHKASINQLVSSDFIRKVTLMLKTLRNQGLAHNIWDFNEDSFWKCLGQIKSVLADVQYYYYIIKKDSMPECAESFYVIGESFLHLGDFRRAVEYLEKCRTRLIDYPDEAEEYRFRKIVDNNIEKICQMKPLVWNTLIKLSEAYLKTRNEDKSKEIALNLLEHVDYDEDFNISYSTLHAVFTDLCTIFVLLKNQLDPNVYIELLESFEGKYGKSIFTLAIGQFYMEQKNYVKAKEVLKYVIENSQKKDEKILYLDKLLLVCLRENKYIQTSEIHNCFDELEALFYDNDSDLVLKAQFMRVKEDSFNRRLRILSSNLCLNGIKESEVIELKRLLTECKEILTIFPKSDDLFLLVSKFIEVSWLFIVVPLLNMGAYLDVSFMPEVFHSDKIDHFLPLYCGNIFSMQIANMATIKKIFLHLTQKARELKEKNPDSTNAKNGLSMQESGDCLYQYAEWLAKDFDSNKDKIHCVWYGAPESSAKMLYKYAIKCYEQMIKYWSEQIDPPDDFITDARVKICNCYRLSILVDFDLQFLNETVSMWKNMLLHPPEFGKIDKTRLEELIKYFEDFPDQIISVLNQIMAASDDNFKLRFDNELVARFLSKYCNIEINENESGKNWIFNHNLERLKEELIDMAIMKNVPIAEIKRWEESM